MKKILIVVGLLLVLTACKSKVIDLDALEEMYESHPILKTIVSELELEEAAIHLLKEDELSLVIAFKTNQGYLDLVELHERFIEKALEDELEGYLYRESHTNGVDPDEINRSLTIEEQHADAQVIVINDLNAYERLYAKSLDLDQLYGSNVIVILSKIGY